MKTYIQLILFCLLASIGANAQTFSYIYIQGDKETPFYVKFEDEMLPRYGKNYYIISELAPGPVNIQVLFQQNAYPVQKFTILVPENGFRGFLLTQKEGVFSLYDIHQRFYLPAGNKAEDDRMPAMDMRITQVPPETPTTEPVAVAEQQPEKRVKQTKPAVVKKPLAKVPVKKPAAPPPSSGPVFLDNVAINDKQGGDMVEAGGKSTGKPSLAVINSDCPRAMSNDDFSSLYKKVENKAATERLKLLMGKLDNCYTTNQVRILTKRLTGDAERYTFLKRAYARVTDQSAFASLELLLSDAEWKGYFKELIQKP